LLTFLHIDIPMLPDGHQGLQVAHEETLRALHWGRLFSDELSTA
jgi:hypothetical protein